MTKELSDNLDEEGLRHIGSSIYVDSRSKARKMYDTVIESIKEGCCSIKIKLGHEFRKQAYMG